MTVDEDLVLKTLRKCNRVVVAEDAKTLKIALPSTKTKLTIQTDNKSMEQLPIFLGSILLNGYRYDVDKSIVVIYGNEESEVAALKNALEKQSGFGCTLEVSDPYYDLKDSIDRAKQQKKEKASYEAYQQLGGWGVPSACKICIIQMVTIRMQGSLRGQEELDSPEKQWNHPTNKTIRNQS